MELKSASLPSFSNKAYRARQFDRTIGTKEQIENRKNELCACFGPNAVRVFELRLDTKRKSAMLSSIYTMAPEDVQEVAQDVWNYFQSMLSKHSKFVCTIY